jgi:hypothetical protein
MICETLHAGEGNIIPPPNCKKTYRNFPGLDVRARYFLNRRMLKQPVCPRFIAPAFSVDVLDKSEYILP